MVRRGMQFKYRLALNQLFIFVENLNSRQIKSKEKLWFNNPYKIGDIVTVLIGEVSNK